MRPYAQVHNRLAERATFQDIRSNIEKIADLSGHCDCEVLLNIATEIWEERRDEKITGPDILGKSKWQELISALLHNQ